MPAATMPAAAALRPPVSVAIIALRQSAAAKPAIQLPIPPLTVGEAALPGSAGVSPGPVNGGFAGVLSGAVNGGSAGVSSKVRDTVLTVPSAADQDACGLGPVAITVSGFLAKPSSTAHLDFSKLGTDHKRFS
ncbi:hypothetical protein SUGI_0894800 [Cryptomeria japonica]|nr:hypothetical protein SUGI_0894800 [Cryptomeria japonica]